MNQSGKVTLSIESAISGGSISLLRGDREAANWIGSSTVSRAEDLLANINNMLASNNISRHEIDLIAVSAGPGSFTGIRIGIATAMGLKTGFGIKMSSESALKAMAFVQPEARHIAAAVPVGRNSLCLQRFSKLDQEVVALDDPISLTENELNGIVQNEKETPFVIHTALSDKIVRAPNIINFGENIAYTIGLVCRENIGLVREPLFISKSF